MPLLDDHERSYAEAFSKMVYCNPFTPERIALEREALEEEFVAADSVWHMRPNEASDGENLVRLHARAEQLVGFARERIASGQTPSDSELKLYEDIVLYHLYYVCRDTIDELIRDSETRHASVPVKFYRKYTEDFDHFFDLPIKGFEPAHSKEHAFACFFQIRRAFHYIFHHIVGSSTAAARLRAAAWQSVFTRDMHRYLGFMYQRMADFTTLIVGPSGTGKELVARAIGLSRYIPFDPKTLTFSEEFTGSFHPLNLSALSPTLIESELFGHRRGAFTGALEDRAGWLEVCRPLGTVFLDEVGEIDGAIQVKLLRVLQTRTFQRLGDTQSKHFLGKIVAATNRDLSKEMSAGRIREDFYYRICSDLIVTPPLREILRESPDELHKTLVFIVRRIMAPLPTEKARSRKAAGSAPDETEVEKLAREVSIWIERNLGRDYAWPGNFRELEQCVRNVLIRGEYRPTAAGGRGAREELDAAIWSGSIRADDLLRRYCTIVQMQTKNYEETARRLGIDRRTVKAKVDERWGEQVRKDKG